jgi:hypothetical protein
MNNLGNLINASYKPQKEAEQSLLEKKKIHHLDKDLSNMETKVFADEGGNPLILHRGTANLKDIGTDLLVAAGLGKYSNRLKKARNITKKTEEKYGKAANSVGSSLGGWIAENSGNHGSIKTYNKAVGLGDLFTTKNKKRQTDIRVKGDLVSLLGKTQNSNKKTIQNKGKGLISAHSSKNLF